MPRLQRTWLIVLNVLLMAWLAHGADLYATWTAPTTNADGSALTDLAGHTLYYGRSSGGYEQALWVGLATSAALSGLEADRDYFLAVDAVDTSDNHSDLSAEVVAHTAALPPPPPPNQPPSVAILSPADGATVPRGKTVTILVDGSDADGSIIEVWVTVNGKALGCRGSTMPLSCPWGVPMANKKRYQIQAFAIDDEGAQTASAVVAVTAR